MINNLFYANSQAAVRITQGSGLRIVNNTLYQPTGNAIEISQESYDIELRNNVLWADSGVALSVAADSQFGFRSDYNLLRLPPAPPSAAGRTATSVRADWYWETGQDGHSLQADPRLVNPAGPDGLLGFSRAPLGPAVIIDNADPGIQYDRQLGHGHRRLRGQLPDAWGGGRQCHGDVDVYGPRSRDPDQVATTWQVNYDYWSEFADDAPFAILDGDRWLAQPRVNQNQRSNDFQDAGVGWRTLGYFLVNTDTLTCSAFRQISLPGGSGRRGARAAGRGRWSGRRRLPTPARIARRRPRRTERLLLPRAGPERRTDRRGRLRQYREGNCQPRAVGPDRHAQRAGEARTRCAGRGAVPLLRLDRRAGGAADERRRREGGVLG